MAQPINFIGNEMLSYLRRLRGLLGPAAPTQIAILDDLFPHPISGFRFEEFCSYLDEMPNVSIYTNGAALPLVNDARPIETIIGEHVSTHPRHLGRILPLRPGQLPWADAYYAIFLNNIVQHVADIERTRKPFAFTLYPGGGFGANYGVSDDKIRRVCRSPSFDGVLVTQPNTREYLLKVHAVPKSKIHYLQGGLVPRAAFVAPKQRRHFGINKESLDIGFVANRYTPRGEDKGYDLFVETAEALTRRGVRVKYHVVGPWDATIIPLGSDLAAQFYFHGFLTTERLRELGQTLDLVLSPNRPGKLTEGAFDGFPTGSCVEVGLQEAAIFCADVLNLNSEFRDGIDLVLVEPNVDDIMRRLLPIILDPNALARIGRNGRARLTQIFGRERQLPPRFALLRTMKAR